MPRFRPRRFSSLLPLLIAVLLAWPLALLRADPLRWKDEIAHLVAKPAMEPGGVVFVGSSSILRWKTLAGDFPGWRTANMGFGGSHLEDSVHYFDQIVRPHAPAVVVLYAGENDLAGGMTLEKVLGDFRAFRARMRESLPQARLVYVSAKPSPQRLPHLAKFTAFNALLAAECARDLRCTFVDVYSGMVDSAGQPRGELFLADQLHMNAAGYALWKERIAPAISGPGAKR